MPSVKRIYNLFQKNLHTMWKEYMHCVKKIYTLCEKNICTVLRKNTHCEKKYTQCVKGIFALLSFNFKWFLIDLVNFPFFDQCLKKHRPYIFLTRCISSFTTQYILFKHYAYIFLRPGIYFFETGHIFFWYRPYIFWRQGIYISLSHGYIFMT